MEFTFADVEKALALTHNIKDAKRSAFAHRLKHLQRLGFPPGTNTGRGRAARYTVGHLYLLGVALELNQLGLSPERAVAAIEDDIHAVAMAAAMAARSGAPSGRFEAPAFLYCDPAALSDLMQDAEGGDRASATFFYAGIGSFVEEFKGWFERGANRVAVFSVSTLLWDLATYSPKLSDDHIERFYAAVEAWTDPLIHNVDYPTDRPDQPYWDTVNQPELDHGDDT